MSSELTVDDDIIRQVVENHTEMFVQPGDYRDTVEGFNRTSIALKWKIISTHDNLVEIQIVFENPLQISPSIQQDLLVVNFGLNSSRRALSEEFDIRLIT